MMHQQTWKEIASFRELDVCTILAL